MSSKLIKTKAVVLSSVNYSEADKIITILTADMGKLSCIAKGARKIKSRFLASTQIFAFSDIILYKGLGELYHLNSAEIIDSFYSLRTDYDKLNCAMECAKFIAENIYENEKTLEILKLFINTLYILTTTNKDVILIKNVFILRMICLMGYVPNIESCFSCGANKNLFYFSFKNRGIKCEECREKSDLTLSSGTAHAIAYIIRSKLKDLFAFEVSQEVLKEIAIFREVYTEVVLK